MSSRVSYRMRSGARRLLCCLALAVSVGGGTVGGTQAWARFNPPPCNNAFSPEQEITEGRKAAAQVYKQLPVLPDSSPVTQYVQQLGAKLAAHAPGQKWPFNYHVVNEADINAFALPGGPVFINLGTIQAVDTEAQLAGVMAHETSHVVLRHATCNATKEQRQKPFWQLGQIVAGVLLPGAAGNVAAAGVGFGAQSLFLRYSRDAERQADLMGTDILYDSGYDPRALPQFFEVIEGKYGKGGAQFLSDHPNPGNRVGYVNDEIATLPPRTQYVKTTNAFKAMKQQVAGMHAYTAKEIQAGAWKQGGAYQGGPGQSGGDQAGSNRGQGGVQGGGAQGGADSGQTAGGQAGAGSVAPAGRQGWQQLKQAQYTVEFPEDWKVYNGANRGSVTIAPQGGVQVTAKDQGAIVTGAIIDSYTPDGSGSGQGGGSGPGPASGDASRAMQELISHLQADNPDMRAAGGVEEVVVNQRRGRSVELNNAAADGSQGGEHDWLVGLPQSDGTLRYVIFVAPAREFERLRPTFEQMLRSLKLG